MATLEAPSFVPSFVRSFVRPFVDERENKKSGLYAVGDFDRERRFFVESSMMDVVFSSKPASLHPQESFSSSMKSIRCGWMLYVVQLRMVGLDERTDGTRENGCT